MDAQVEPLLSGKIDDNLIEEQDVSDASDYDDYDDSDNDVITIMIIVVIINIVLNDSCSAGTRSCKCLCGCRLQEYEAFRCLCRRATKVRPIYSLLIR